MRAYIEDWLKLSMKNIDQRTRTRFLAKHREIYLYDINFGNRYSINDEKTHFVKRDIYALIST